MVGTRGNTKAWHQPEAPRTFSRSALAHLGIRMLDLHCVLVLLAGPRKSSRWGGEPVGLAVMRGNRFSSLSTTLDVYRKYHDANERMRGPRCGIEARQNFTETHLPGGRSRAEWGAAGQTAVAETGDCLR